MYQKRGICRTIENVTKIVMHFVVFSPLTFVTFLLGNGSLNEKRLLKMVLELNFASTRGLYFLKIGQNFSTLLHNTKRTFWYNLPPINGVI
jgi:hypothetical protein